MDEFRNKSTREEVGGKGQRVKGKVKEGVGKLAGDDDLEAEGQADQAEGRVREGVGKAGRTLSDVADAAKDKLDDDDK
jgi:uncharacterized protein YjbJ (UPF0337 family)